VGKRVLLLIPSNSYKAADFLEAATKLNVEVVVASNKQQTLVSPDSLLTLDFLSVQDAVEKVIAFAATHPLDAIFSTDEEGRFLASILSQSLGLPENHPDAIRATQDKSLLRTILSSTNVPTPKAACFSIDDPPSEIALNVDYPCVLKPIHLSASRGVIRANHPQEFTIAFERIIKILNDPEVKRDGMEKKILVESFIPGVEVAIEGVLQNGVFSMLAIFDKPDPLNGPFFEETIYVTPSRLSDKTQKAIHEMTEQACMSIGLKEGPIHAELRINDQGPFVIEVAARSIGGICSRALTFGMGRSLETLLLQQALKLPIASMKRADSASGVMMIPIPNAGTFVDIRGVEAAKKIPGIFGVTIMIRRKQKVVPLPEGRRYLGFIFARGANPSDVEAALRMAHRELQFEIAS